MGRSRGKPPSQRQLRVGEELRHILAQALVSSDVHDPVLQEKTITVTEVRVSPDLKNATAFVLPLGGADEGSVLAALKRAAPYFRKRIADAVALRYTPRVSFQLDRSFAEAARVDALLRSERVRKDLEQPAESGADEEEEDHGASS